MNCWLSIFPAHCVESFEKWLVERQWLRQDDPADEADSGDGYQEPEGDERHAPGALAPVRAGKWR